MESVDQLFEQFQRVRPRHAQILVARLLDGRSREECAARYGVKPESWDIMYFRAARDFVEGKTDPLPFEEEQHLAGDDPWRAQLQPLADHAAELKKRIE